MPAPFNATHEEIAYCLGYFYPTMIWTLTGTDYEGLTVLPGSPVPKPTLQDIQSHIPEARTRIAAMRAKDLKESTFRQQYSVNDVDIILSKRIATPNNAAAQTVFNDMLAYWNSLP